MTTPWSAEKEQEEEERELHITENLISTNSVPQIMVFKKSHKYIFIK